MRNFKHYYEKVSKDTSEKDSVPAGLKDPIAKAKSIGYTEKELQSVPEGVVMGMGCGNPVAPAKLKKGQTVLDIGCGGGLDVFLAARRVGNKGHVIGLDGTRAMLDRATVFAVKGGYTNVEFILGEMENIPLQDNSIDVVISNCVINHAQNKVGAFGEIRRCLKSGGRMLISDLVIEGPFSEEVLRDKIWGAWIAGALGKQDYLNAIEKAGFQKITLVSENLFYMSEADDRLKGKILSLNIEAYK